MVLQLGAFTGVEEIGDVPVYYAYDGLPPERSQYQTQLEGASRLRCP